MDFDNKININPIQKCEIFKKETKDKSSTQNKSAQNDAKIKLPNSPKYWQNLTFKGSAANKDASETLNNAEAQEAEELLSCITINTTVNTIFGPIVQKRSGLELLNEFNITAKDIKKDAFDFLKKLNCGVIEYLGEFSFKENNDYLPKLLTKTGTFENCDFDKLSANADFLNYLYRIGGKQGNILKQVHNVAFLRNPDFDVNGMKHFIRQLRFVEIKDPVSNKYNFSMFTNLAMGHHSITDILNSKTFDAEKTKDFLMQLKHINVSMPDGYVYNFPSIIKEHNLYNLITNPNTDYTKVLELAREIRESGGYDEDEICRLINNVSSSKYSGKEYLNAYKYFNNILDNKGENIVTGRNGRMCKNNLIFNFLNINPASVEASNVEMLIRLVQDGVVGKHVFEYLPKEGKINQNVTDDIVKLYDAYISGLDPKEAFIPTFKNEKEALSGGNESVLFDGSHKELKKGDVFQVEGEDFIRIKTNENQSKLLNISKDTYFELFPPIERYASTQNDIGNCWELTGINSLLSEPDTRELVLGLFKETKDDIEIEFPKGNCGKMVFKNKKLPEESDANFHSKGSLGVQMLEHADGKEIMHERIDNVYKKIQELIDNAPNEYEKERLKTAKKRFNETVLKNKNNISLKESDKKIFWGEYRGEYDSAFTEARVGGSSNNLYRRIGLKDARCINYCDEEEYIKDFLKRPESFENNIINWASDTDAKYNEYGKNDLGLVDGHAYRILPAKIEKGEVTKFKLINPWGTSETELTYGQVLESIMALYVARKETE